MIRTTASLLTASVMLGAPAFADTWQGDVSNDWFGGVPGTDTNWDTASFPDPGDDADIFNNGIFGSPVANAPITAGQLDIGGFAVNGNAVSTTVNAGGSLGSLALKGGVQQTYAQNGGTMTVSGSISTENTSGATHLIDINGGTFIHNGVINGDGGGQALDIEISNATFNSGGQGGGSNTRSITADLTNSDITIGTSGNFILGDASDSLNLTIGSNNAGGVGTDSIDSTNFFTLAVAPTINAIGTGFAVGEIIELATITGNSINPNNFFAPFPAFSPGDDIESARVAGSSNGISFELFGQIDNVFTGDSQSRVLLEVTDAGVIPEPASLALLGLGGLALLGRGRRNA